MRRVLANWALGIGLCLASHAAAPPDRALDFLEAKVKADPDDFVAWNQLGERCLARRRESGDEAWLARAAQAAEASLKSIPAESNPAGLALRARVDLASHRFADARDRARKLRDLQPGKPGPLIILADALLDLGENDEAARALDALDPHSPLDTTTRRARLALARGQRDTARDLFTKARDAAKALTPPQPLTLAWCEVQLGELAHRSGDWDAAEPRYLAALDAVPEWWSALDHLAELRAAQGRTGEAFAIYEKLIAKTPRPELLQAVGDLHLFLGKADAAKPWHDRALAAYLDATAKGSVAYYHHLAGFHCDSRPDPAAALDTARKDAALRKTAGAHDALAWALYKSGDTKAAAAEIALATGPRDAHILQHTAMIRISNGEVAAGQAALREAAAVNPRFNAFHVHR